MSLTSVGVVWTPCLALFGILLVASHLPQKGAFKSLALPHPNSLGVELLQTVACDSPDAIQRPVPRLLGSIESQHIQTQQPMAPVRPPDPETAHLGSHARSHMAELLSGSFKDDRDSSAVSHNFNGGQNATSIPDDPARGEVIATGNYLPKDALPLRSEEQLKMPPKGRRKPASFRKSSDLPRSDRAHRSNLVLLRNLRPYQRIASKSAELERRLKRLPMLSELSESVNTSPAQVQNTRDASRRTLLALVEKNLGLVIREASAVSGPWEEESLVSSLQTKVIGSIPGGIRAIEASAMSYDETKNTTFATWMGWKVRKKISENRQDVSSIIDLSPSEFRSVLMIKAVRNKLFLRHGRWPSITELCESTNSTIIQVKTALQLNIRPKPVEEFCTVDNANGSLGGVGAYARSVAYYKRRANRRLYPHWDSYGEMEKHQAAQLKRDRLEPDVSELRMFQDAARAAFGDFPASIFTRRLGYGGDQASEPASWKAIARDLSIHVSKCSYRFKRCIELLRGRRNLKDKATSQQLNALMYLQALPWLTPLALSQRLRSYAPRQSHPHTQTTPEPYEEYDDDTAIDDLDTVAGIDIVEN